jgi:hypothetical protein
MASRRRPHESDPNANTPSQQDEADIVAESGAERDEDIGELVADEDRVRALGAVDAESVRENRRLKSIVDKKRGGVKGVPFNAGDVLTKYETLIKFWPVNTIDISVKRLTGSPVQQMILSRPRSGAELYEALKGIHGQYEEAKYELKFFDNNSKEFRGNGQITLPDTRQAAPQQGQHMTYPPGYPPGYQPGYPPGYPQPQPVFGYPVPQPIYQHAPPQPQPGAAPPQQPPQQQAPQQQAPQQPPTVQVMPSSFDPHQMMSMMDQMFGMFRQMQSAAQPPPQPQPQFQFQPIPVPVPQPVPMPLPQQMPPPPSPQASPTEQMEWMQRAFGMFQQMMQASAASVPPQPMMMQPPPPPSPQMPPPSQQLAETMSMMEQMFKMFQRLQGPPPGSPGPGSGGPPYRGPFRPPPYGGGPGAPYPGAPYPGGPPTYPSGPPTYPDGSPRPYGSPYGAPPGPPPREKTAAEQFREAMTVVRTAVAAVQDINAMMPGAVPGAFAAEPPHEKGGEDESPIQVIDTGPAKLVINKQDGSLRGWETGWANMDKVFKWVGEQREAIQKSAVERRAEERQVHQLPPGYVEVGPGYQPPPGYVAVPIDPQQMQHALPPPPVDVPPPIHEPPQQRPTWGMPAYPGQGEE